MNLLASKFKLQPLNQIDSTLQTAHLIFINGFLQQNDEKFEDWLAEQIKLNHSHALYGLNWASQTFEDFQYLINETLVKKNYLQLINNPWYRAMLHAQQEGKLLAKYLLTQNQKIILVGHSLGARVIYCALKQLAVLNHCCIEDVFLLGGAVGNQTEDSEIVSNVVQGKIYNCYSKKDDVLYYSYRSGSLGLSKAVGCYPIESQNDKIHNLDCTKLVSSHFKWKENYAALYQLLMNVD